MTMKVKKWFQAAALVAAGYLLAEAVGEQSLSDVLVASAYAGTDEPRAPQFAVESREVPCYQGWAIASFPKRPLEHLGQASALLHFPGRAGPYGRFEWAGTHAMIGDGVIGVQCPWGVDRARFIF